MRPIAFYYDEENNKKIVLRADTETEIIGVGCFCCNCGGCRGIEDAFGVTTLNYEATVPNEFNQVQSVSGVLDPTSSDCRFQSNVSVYEFFVEIEVANVDNECRLSVSVFKRGPMNTATLYGHITLEQPPVYSSTSTPTPPPELPITIDLAGTVNQLCFFPPCQPPIPVTGTITIS